MEAKKIKITNHNNVLACQVFATINWAPDRDKMPPFDELEKQLYFVEHNDDRIYLQLIDIAFYSFQKITDHQTLLTNGVMADEWREKWWQLNPATTVDSLMGIYFYRKIQSPLSS